MREGRSFAIAIGVVLVFVLGACTTTATFKIPEGTQLEVYRRPVTVGAGGTVTMRPFWWTAAGVPPAGGIEYRLLDDGKVVKQGRLRATFRVASIFAPIPGFGVLMWPMGFNPDITYDLVNDKQE